MTITRNVRTPIMHRAVEANGTVYVGGTIGDDTSVSMGEQTRNILSKIAGYLREAGTDQSNVVSAAIFVTDLSQKKEMDAVWTELLRRPPAGARCRGRRGPRRQRPDRSRGHGGQGVTSEQR